MAVVGPNGVGKSSLLRLIAGEVKPTSGQIAVNPPAANIGLIHQEPARTNDTTVRQLLSARTGVTAATTEFEASTLALAADEAGSDDRFDQALAKWTSLGAADFDARLAKVGDDIGLAESTLDRPLPTLSGGEAARIGLATVLLSRFDLTMLDEPTNDLDAAGLDKLEQWVQEHQGGLVFVSHDRAFLANAAIEVFEIDEHSRSGRLFGGGWDAFLDEKAVARAHAEDEYQHYTDRRDQLKAQAKQKRDWVAKGTSKLKKNPDPDKHRNAYDKAQNEALAGKASATDRALERLVVVDKPWEGWDLQFTIATAQRSGSIVAALDNAVIGRGEFRLGPLTVEIRWADRVSITGPNGSGKSTLIEVLLGRLDPISGHAVLGSSVLLGELDQLRGAFHDGAKSLIDVITADGKLGIAEARSVLAKFGLAAAAVARPASSLSPGERTRAQLAMFQAMGVNCVVLDEPTNHLDLQAIEQLESALGNYEGTLILVSHDREFLNNVETTVQIDLTSGRAVNTLEP